MVDDTERRLNVLFDALNCGTISAGTVAQVREITNGALGRAARQQTLRPATQPSKRAISSWRSAFTSSC
jgi:hypothetical protein